MHGLVNRAIESFVCDSYGRTTWLDTVGRLDLGYTEFEAMITYDPTVTERVLIAVSDRLARSRDDLLEDIGTYMVSHPANEAVRRLMRFSGVDFLDFLYSLDDLPDRARLAVSDLTLPTLELHDHGPGCFWLHVALPDDASGLRFGHVVMGLLRAMADDYGGLVLVEHRGADATHEHIEIRLLEERFARGRSFELGTKGGP